MPSPAEVVRRILIDGGLVIFPGIAQQPDDLTIQCFTNEEPDTPDNVMMLHDTAGLGFGRIQTTGKFPRHPGVKMLMRSLDSRAGYDAMYAAVEYLAGFRRRAVDLRGYRCFVSSIYQTTGLISLGEEEGTKRFHWSFNMRLAMEDTDQALLE